MIPLLRFATLGAAVTAAGAGVAAGETTALVGAAAGVALRGSRAAVLEEPLAANETSNWLPVFPDSDQPLDQLGELLHQLEEIELQENPTMFENALDGFKLLAMAYMLASPPSRTIERLGGSLAHIVENFEDKRVFIAGILSITFGEAKTLTDFKAIIENIIKGDSFPLLRKVQDIRQQNQGDISPKTSEDFATLLSESLVATGLKEEEKNKLLSLVHAMHIPNALTKKAAALLSAVEGTIFPSHFCQGFLPTQQAKNEILKFLKPDDTQPLTKESLEQKIGEIFQNETQKTKAIDLLNNLITTKQSAEQNIALETLGVEFVFSLFFNSVIVSGITASVVACQKKDHQFMHSTRNTSRKRSGK